MSAPRIINPATAGGGVPVGGSGAAGYVAKWTAATTLGGSTTTGATASLYVDATGNVGIGTASPGQRLTVAGGFIATAAGYGVYQPGDHLVLSAGNAKNVQLKPNDGGLLAVNVGATSCDFTGVANYGLKLATTPGNTDPNTLDCYAEDTWTPTLTGFGGTAPTVTAARYTRIGRLVSLQLHLSAVPATTFSSAAGGTFVSLPAGMTPPVSAPGATSNSGIAADGSCVAYTNGNLYLPTFALRSADTFLNVTYTV